MLAEHASKATTVFRVAARGVRLYTRISSVHSERTYIHTNHTRVLPIHASTPQKTTRQYGDITIIIITRQANTPVNTLHVPQNNYKDNVMLRRSFTTQLVRDGCFVRIFRDTHRRNSTQSQPNTRFIQFLTTVPISIRRVIFEISPLPHTLYTPDFFSFFFTAKIRRVNRLECGSFGTSLNRGYTSCVPVDEHVFLTEISRSF